MVEVRSIATVLLTGLLTGCAAGGPIPDGIASTAPDRAPREGPVLPGTVGTNTSLLASNGSKVVASEWLPRDPRAVIVALHGFGDYGQLTFRGPATAWAEQGIATIAPDQRGFGRNASRGRWPGADGLIADAENYVAQARARFPCTPVVLLGHSMGGGVALAAAPRSQPDALVLATPAIWGGRALNPLHRLASWVAATTVPERRFTGKGVVRIIPSDNRDALWALWADPLYLAPPSAREIQGLVRITDRASEAVGRTQVPALLLLGSKDQIVPSKRVRSVFARLQGHRDVIEYDDGWHLIFRDLQASRVWNDVARYVLAVPNPEGCT
ncbi:MAG: alpha/beta fold hydrolase [Paracoccaceae bacterium]